MNSAPGVQDGTRGKSPDRAAVLRKSEEIETPVASGGEEWPTEDMTKLKTTRADVKRAGRVGSLQMDERSRAEQQRTN